MEPQKRLSLFARCADWLLTVQQRRAAAVALLLLALLAVWQAKRRGPILTDPLPPAGPLAGDVLTTLDPETAGAEEWMSLPGIGPAMAERILAYRTQWKAAHPQTPAFGRLEDLDKVRGIGPATLQRLKPYLRFPGE